MILDRFPCLCKALSDPNHSFEVRPVERCGLVWKTKEEVNQKGLERSRVGSLRDYLDVGGGRARTQLSGASSSEADPSARARTSDARAAAAVLRWSVKRGARCGWVRGSSLETKLLGTLESRSEVRAGNLCKNQREEKQAGGWEGAGALLHGTTTRLGHFFRQGVGETRGSSGTKTRLKASPWRETRQGQKGTNNHVHPCVRVCREHSGSDTACCVSPWLVHLPCLWDTREEITETEHVHIWIAASFRSIS